MKFGKSNGDRKLIFFESLILAQDERWRRALSMQVERSGCFRKRMTNQWRTGEYKQGTYPKLSDSSSKDGVIWYVDASLKLQNGLGAALFPSACW